MKLFKFFQRKKKQVTHTLTESTESFDYTDFDIEYFPLSGRYYPRYKGQYMFIYSGDGSYHFSYGKVACEFASSVKKAKRIIQDCIRRNTTKSTIINLT